MEINLKNHEAVMVAELMGDIDAKTAPEVRDKVLPLIVPGSKILLDLTKVPYLSSAGLRVLLLLYRQVSSKDGKIVLVGLSEEITDIMAITGFLDFFITSDTIEAGLVAIS